MHKRITQTLSFMLLTAVTLLLSNHVHAHSDHGHTIDILVTSIERSEDKKSLFVEVNINNHYDDTVTLTTLAADIANTVTVSTLNTESEQLEAVPLESISIVPNKITQLKAPTYRIEFTDIAEADQDSNFVSLYFNFGTDDVYSVSKYIQ